MDKSASLDEVSIGPTTPEIPTDVDLSRRGFLARLAALVAVGTVASGCPNEPIRVSERVDDPGSPQNAPDSNQRNQDRVCGAAMGIGTVVGLAGEAAVYILPQGDDPTSRKNVERSGVNAAACLSGVAGLAALGVGSTTIGGGWVALGVATKLLYELNQRAWAPSRETGWGDLQRFAVGATTTVAFPAAVGGLGVYPLLSLWFL